MDTITLPAVIQPVYSKISHVPDLLCDGQPILSLYADAELVLHMQSRLRDSGRLVLFPVTFRLVNAYLNGEFTLAELLLRAPCHEVTLVTRGHNLLPLPKDGFDFSQLTCAELRYPDIEDAKSATLAEIRDGLHACMRA